MKTKKEKTLKRISVFLAFIFVNQILFPTAALALTGGPGQPELESFTPFNSTDMVDPFTGDFEYNIPLLNVPGPNGGYPINISYSGDVAVDQEASWVGSGWNLNPGAINRQLRGLPDDFDGSQKVVRERKMKPNRTYTIGLGTSFSEIFGFDLSKISKDLQVNGNLNLTMNNYSGFNMGLGLGFSTVEADATKGSEESSEKPSDNDKQQDTKKSFAKKMKELLKEEVEDTEKVFSKENLKKHYKNKLKKGIKKTVKKVPSAVFFSGSADKLSSIDFPRSSNSFTFEGKLGAAIIGVTADVEFRLFYSQQNYSTNNKSYPAYGYMHTESGTKNDKAMLDYHTVKNSSLNPSSAFLPLPILTNDVFSVTGQGVGGVYRPQSGTIPLLSKPIVNSSSDSYGLGADFSGSPNDIKVGVNPKASFTDSKSGKWKSGDAAVGFFRESLGLTAQVEATYEQNTFLKLGDLTDNQWHEEKILSSNKPMRLGLSTEFQSISIKPKIKSVVVPKSGGSFLISKPDRIKEKRSARTNLFKYYTGNELNAFGGYGTGTALRQARNIGNTLNIPINVTSNSLINKIEVENQGMNYVYGIPVFTHSKIDRTFSVTPPSNTTDFDPVSTDGTVSFNSGDDSQSNSQGRAAMFNSNKVEKFAHAYLLTEILSDDYVDITDNGPSEDDFGSYTEFQYYRAYSPEDSSQSFKSQSPALRLASDRKASLVPGANSDKEDDLASYSLSEKDIYYVYKIETKTHYAEFSVSARSDDYGLVTGGSAQSLYKLDEIKLYKKNASGADKEIKSVEFEYYSSGSSSNVMQNAPVAQNGKLTLKSIRFKFEGFKTNSYLNPYQFDYYNTDAYTDGCTDKWGKFQPNVYNDFGSNYLYPYVAQDRDINGDGSINDLDKALRDRLAANWNLRTITLPTGGEIDVEYESDDYAYVQDKEAQSMFEIVGIGAPGDWTLDDDQIYFRLKKPISTNSNSSLAVANQLKKGQKYAYFKAMVRLKSRPNKYKTYGGFSDGGDIVETVDGYLNLSNVSFTPACIDPSTSQYIYGVATVAKTKGKNAIRSAAVQYMRLNGAYYNSSIDISFSGATGKSKLMGIASAIIKGATQDKDLNKDFLEAAFGVKQFCKKMSGNYPSVIRLNAQDGFKYGGGSRVKSIVVKDNWNTMQSSETTFNTKQVYSYLKEDGTTSGVAEYEPLTGGEENPFRQPYYYSNEKGILNSKKIMFELPATESLFPSAGVGYSRVVMETVPVTTAGAPISGYSLSSNGIQVQEFYTAKDYPVITSATKIKKVNMKGVAKFLKFLGGKDYFHPGFSQGYYTELNDMHGKMKKSSTYSTTLGTSEAPFQTVSYFYKTEDGGYSKGKANRISSDVEVLTNDGFVETKTLGEVSDAWIEMSEDDTRTIGGDIKFNIDNLIFGFIPIPIPIAVPDIDYSYRMRRTAVLNKLSSKTAILEKVVTQQEGRTTVANNLLFDYENGSPLLTQVINDFSDPIYTYNRPMHWVNDGFKSPWRNWKAHVNNQTYEGIIQNGDRIIDANGNSYWVEDEETGLLKNETGTLVYANSGWSGGTIVESGYSGKTTAMSSQIVSLVNPADSGAKEFVLFEKYNNKPGWDPLILTDVNSGSGIQAEFFYDCDTDPLYQCSPPDSSETFCPKVGVEHTPTASYLHFTIPNVTGTASIVFPGGYQTQLGNFTLRKIGNKVEATLGNVVLILDWNDPQNLFIECMPGVLDAGATLYADNLNEYEVLENTSAYSITKTGDIDPNPVRYKNRYNYKVAQTVKPINTRTFGDDGSTNGFFETEIREDGTHTAYVDYNFTSSVQDNASWLDMGQITHYDPFGNQIENLDPLGVYSSELFDKDHTLVTANAVNASYEEVGYQSFEDYSGTYTGSFGHIKFNNTPTIYADGHTGKKSASVVAGTKLELSNLEPNKPYRVSLWQFGNTNALGASSSSLTVDAEEIDNWNLITFTFTPLSTAYNLDIQNAAIIDDIRFYPADAAMKTYVYDVATQRLIASLDANNFATLYGYNEEGTLAFVKKETHRGIHTVSNYIVHRKK